MSRKIITMKNGAKEFIDQIHIDGTHTGIVNSFDSSVSLGTLRSSVGPLKSRIDGLSASGQTALYDSIYHSIGSLSEAHYSANRHGIPMAVLTFTDGQENRSKRDVGDVRSLIRKLDFFPSNNCYVIIAGVGNASEQEMKELCRDGYGLYIDANGIDEVFSMFRRVLTSLIRKKKSSAVRIRQDGKIIEAKKSTVTPGVAIKKLDYGLNLDCSASMG
jgi:hypothetical protein